MRYTKAGRSSHPAFIGSTISVNAFARIVLCRLLRVLFHDFFRIILILCILLAFGILHLACHD
jgi:hypothetical protein